MIEKFRRDFDSRLKISKIDKIVDLYNRGHFDPFRFFEVKYHVMTIYKSHFVNQSDFALRVGDLLLVIFSDDGAFFA